MKIIFLALTFLSFSWATTFKCEKNKSNRKIASYKDQLDNCVKKDIYGCLYMRQDDCNPNSDTLVIYLRGHWKYKGYVPTHLRDQSLREVISTYELDKSYGRIQEPMLISSSSNVGFTVKEVDNVLAKAGLPINSNIIIAAHSGAYHGLDKTLKYFKKTKHFFKVKKIIMLDNFYFGTSTSSLIKEYVDAGAECNGFLTAHNQTRYNNRFKPYLNESECPIQKKKNHYTAVNKCLESYVKDNICYFDPN